MKKIIFICLGILGAESQTQASLNRKFQSSITNDLNVAITSGNISDAIEIANLDSRFFMDIPDDEVKGLFEHTIGALANCTDENTRTNLQRLLNIMACKMKFPLSNGFSDLNNSVVKNVFEFCDENTCEVILAKIANNLHIDVKNSSECIRKAAERNIITYKTARLIAEKMTRALVEAVMKSDVKKVRKLLAAGANPNMSTDRPEELPDTFMFESLDNHNTVSAIECAFDLEAEKLNRLIDLKTEIKELNKFRENFQTSDPFIEDQISQLEEEKRNVNTPRNDIETRNKEIRKLLISRQNEIDNQLENLFTDVEHGRFVDINRIFSSVFINLNRINKEGKTLLHLAVESKNIPLANQLVGVLISAEAFDTIGAMDISGRTPLHYLAMYGSQSSFFLARRLMWYSDVNAEDSFGATPLSYAVANNNVLFAWILLSNGADNYFMKEKNHVYEIVELMRLAITNKNHALLSLLLRFGAKNFINELDIYGKSALDYSLDAGAPTIVQLLLQNGAIAY